jgi:ABC-type lipoprotein export system ATPase subunit
MIYLWYRKNQQLQSQHRCFIFHAPNLVVNRTVNEIILIVYLIRIISDKADTDKILFSLAY